MKKQAVAIIVTDTGHVENKTDFAAGRIPTRAKLKKWSIFLTSAWPVCRIPDLKDKNIREIADILKQPY